MDSRHALRRHARGKLLTVETAPALGPQPRLDPALLIWQPPDERLDSEGSA